MLPARCTIGTLLKALLCCSVFSSCAYAGLLRPKVLGQLDPDVARLVNELAEVDQPNEDIVARLFPHGGLVHANSDREGLMTARELEVDITNEDHNFHAALIPSDGDRQLLELPMHNRGTVRVRLAQPGLSWFGCPVANPAGRGMLGLVLVRGEIPDEAKLIWRYQTGSGIHSNPVTYSVAGKCNMSPFPPGGVAGSKGTRRSSTAPREETR